MAASKPLPGSDLLASTSSLVVGGPTGPVPTPDGAVLRRMAARVTTGLRDPLVVVLGAWLAAFVGLWNLVQMGSIGLPFCDEYCFVPVATGQREVSAGWLWEPANEHRIPLLKLYLVWLGELAHWDFRVFLRTNLAVLGVGALALVLAVRAVRGRSTLADSFLPLLVLSPQGFDAVVLYSFAYTSVFGLLAMTLALVATGLVYRRWWAAAGYAAAVPTLALAGGPAGQLWAVALATALPFVWVRTGLGRFRYAVVAALVAGAVVAALLIWTTPKQPAHDSLRAATAWDAARFAAKHAVGWLGLFPLKVLWPYAAVAVAVPLLYVAVRVTGRLAAAVRGWSLSAGDLPTWAPVAAVLGATLTIAAVIGYTRGETYVWSPRYHCMLGVVGVAMYLLLVRFGSPPTLTGALAVVMLVCYGWTWQGFLGTPSPYPAEQRRALVTGLREGKVPLSVLAVSHGMQTGIGPGDATPHLIGWWMDLRAQRLSEFRKMPPYVQPFTATVRAGELDGNLQLVPDPRAVHGGAVRLHPWVTEGRVRFRFHVPAGGWHQVWVRCRTESAGPHRITARLDEGTPFVGEHGQTQGFQTDRFGQALLQAGEHTLDVTLHSPGVVVDLVEVVRQP